MKKIMFNDKYGLTAAVLDGLKTMTRRIVPQSVLDKVPAYQAEYYAGALEPISTEDAILNMVVNEGICKAPYQIGEVVAVAQAYKDIPNYLPDASAGWNNKLFVRATEMPLKIRITDLHVERMQDISDEDILREGIWWNKKTGQFIVGNKGFALIRKAFIYLIDKVSGKGTWDKNPLVFAYEFELIK